MEKKKITKVLRDNGVKSTNVRSFLRTKKNQNLVGLVGVSSKKLERSISKFSLWLKKEEEKQKQKEQKEYHKKEASRLKISLKTFLEIKEKAERILESFHTGHSMGCYRTLIANQSNGEQFKTQYNSVLYTYAGNAWRPNYGQLFISITFNELINLENIEGLWTIRMPQGKAKWLEQRGQKQHAHVVWVEGWLYKDSHSTTSLADAKLIQNKKEEFLKQKEQTEKELISKNTKFVGAQHIKALGACEAGIKAFCRRHNLNPEMGYNLGYLKSLNDSYARRYLEKI